MNRNSNQITLASGYPRQNTTNGTTHISLQTNQISSTNKGTGEPTKPEIKINVAACKPK